MSMAGIIKLGGRTAAGILFPPTCPNCDRVLPLTNEGRLCEKCEGVIAIRGDYVCFKCGRTLTDEGEELCKRCRGRSFSFERNFSLYPYKDELRDMLVRFKYKSRRDYAYFLGHEAVKGYGSELKSLGIDAIVPVPVHKSRLKKRGYNQAQALSGVIADELGLPHFPDLIERVKHTRAQKELDAVSRFRNLKDAFEINANELALAKRRSSLKCILLVDDIFTTGATLEGASLKLKEACGAKVWTLTISQTEY